MILDDLNLINARDDNAMATFPSSCSAKRPCRVLTISALGLSRTMFNTRRSVGGTLNNSPTGFVRLAGCLAGCQVARKVRLGVRGALFISSRLNARVARENGGTRKLRALETVTTGKRTERACSLSLPPAGASLASRNLSAKRIPPALLLTRHDTDVGGGRSLVLSSVSPLRSPPLLHLSLFLLSFLLLLESVERLTSDGKHSGHATRTESRRPRVISPGGLQRGSIHPNVSLFHNKIVMRCPDWLGSLEGSHNASGACPCQYSRDEVRMRPEGTRRGCE